MINQPWWLTLSDWAHSLLLGWGLPEWGYALLVTLIKAVVVLGFVLTNALFLIWLERKLSGRIQNRPGPMRTGWHGTLQTMADVFKLLTKEDLIPHQADRWVFRLAPIVAFAPALMIFVVIPFGPHLIAGDLNIAIVYVAALTSFTVLSFLMAGWSSNSKWPLLGAMRAAAQLVSYEIPLLLSVVAVAMMAGTLSLQGIVHWQQDHFWTILVQWLGFAVFLVASMAELNRPPFDETEAESELVAGYNTEYSGMRWAMFFLAEYTNLVSSAAIAVTLYFGGWGGPWLPPIIWFFLKVYLFVAIGMWIRWTFPRIRVDQLMELGWKGLLPLSFVNILITGAFVLAR